MSYLVSLQEGRMPFGFTCTFSEADRSAILNAEMNVRFILGCGAAYLDKFGDLLLTLRSPGGHRHHCVNYVEICRQLSRPSGVVLYEHSKA